MAEGIVTEPEYVAHLSTALKTALKDAQITHERVRGDRFRFVVISDEFDGMEHPQRQRKVWDLADKTLGKDNLLNVAMIITLSPTEM